MKNEKQKIVCKRCGGNTRVWWNFDGLEGIRMCNECYRKIETVYK